MNDFFDDIDVSTKDISTERKWDISFEIRIYTKNCELNYKVVRRLLERNINALNFRNSEITEFEINEDCSDVLNIAAKRLADSNEYTFRKVFIVNLNCSVNSAQDAIDLMSTMIFTKYESSTISKCNVMLQLLCWIDNECTSMEIYGDAIPNIFIKHHSFSVNTQQPNTLKKALIEIGLMYRHIYQSHSAYQDISYHLNTYIFDAAISPYLVKEHRMLLEAEDHLPKDSTLHGWKYIYVERIPHTWQDEKMVFVANTRDNSKNYLHTKIDRHIDIDALDSLLNNTPEDIMVTLSLNKTNKFEMPDDKTLQMTVRDENRWEYIYEFNGDSGIVIIDSNKKLEYNDTISEFLNNHRSSIRHSMNMVRYVQSFINPDNGKAGVVFDLCTYISPLYKKHLLLATFGIYGKKERVEETFEKLFDLNGTYHPQWMLFQI